MKSLPFSSIITLLLLTSILFPQTYDIGTWRGFRSAAITYTFDDNCRNQLAKAVPMFDEYDFDLTLYVVINWSPDWSGLQTAASNGHEIASHTNTHTSFSGMADDKLISELKNSQESINSHITGLKCVTISYPYCNTGKSSIVKQYYFAARGCQGYIEGKTPSDFMNISSLICGTEGSVKTANDFQTKADNAAASKGWLVYLIHGIDNDGGYSPIPSADLKASIEYLNDNREKFWVSTFANVAKYIRERNSVSITEISVKKDTITVEVSDTLDNSLYDYPVTIRRPLPSGWTTAGIIQNGAELNSAVVEVNSVKYIMFDAVPDMGNIYLIKDMSVPVDRQGSIDSYNLFQNYPNPFNPSTTISYSIPAAQNVEIKILDIIGNESAILLNEYQTAGTHKLEFSAHKFSSGIYFYQLKTSNYSAVKKLILLK